jgi:hypothetical protein
MDKMQRKSYEDRIDSVINNLENQIKDIMESGNNIINFYEALDFVQSLRIAINILKEYKRKRSKR